MSLFDMTKDLIKKIIIDLDDTISFSSDANYSEATPVLPVIEKLKYYRSLNFSIVIFTSRNMRTYEGDIGKINIHTLPTIIDWLKKYEVPFDEVIVGKPWCGNDGFYVDDKSIRPSEFANLNLGQIQELIAKK
jgi:capsule biosynthesis phosphatase